MKSIITAILRKFIYHISGICPRTNKAVMGSYKNQFSDNAKYLYLHWQQTGTLRSIWISGDDTVINQLKKDGFEAYNRRSIRGIFHCLTAKYYFYNTYIGDINQYFAKGATKVNLWHGSPLKKIEFDIKSGPLAPPYQNETQIQRWGNALKFHQQHVKPDLMLSPSLVVDSLFTSAFRLESEQLIRSGNPRTDYFKRYPEQAKSISTLVNTQHDKVILYVPTWRDSSANHSVKSFDKNNKNKETNTPYDRAFDWPALSKQLVQNNQLFLVRFHPNEAHLGKRLNQYPNIIDISHWEDVYSILQEIDLLITDQSSLFVDLLLHQTPILFYSFEQESMTEQPREVYDYAENLPLVGEVFTHTIIDTRYRVHQFQALLDALNRDESFHITPSVINEYQLLRNIFWQPKMNDAFENIESYLFSNKQQGNTNQSSTDTANESN
ncbi:CDP-glycerol glycerophosphotransferase family protein [Shewanella sp. D64]|uniref:CDP-glycerol glycerophosphotransferase family protein n=1 Tax=unclassified Shewanella TaxID=196818 RepID=UPI0022BA2FFC|nr:MULTISPECIES: CDP-glycerol glycerophosphotransferase family protein [unclassified Shewanella]MEC4727758.1 CDP-glycerol glycerophosphotransferase family protein [Shewanella sp. D64]MEC4737521.1 CDP-glycerol glycerophosphotransferase family protein [Shewanella sp. E94]WBJ97330.1 CDP-glycerol glycerophosphotransferase family protein [Shewanella sp. MTB7]